MEFNVHGTFDCSFEVGYNYDCKIVIVLHLVFYAMMSIFGTKDIDEKTSAALAHFGFEIEDKERLSYGMAGNSVILNVREYLAKLNIQATR